MTSIKLVAGALVLGSAAAFAPLPLGKTLRSNAVTGLSMKQFPYGSKVDKAIGDAKPIPTPATSGSFEFRTGNAPEDKQMYLFSLVQ